MSKLSQSEIDALFAMHSADGEGVSQDAAGNVQLSVPPAPTAALGAAPAAAAGPAAAPSPAPAPIPAPAASADVGRPAVFPTLERVSQRAAPASPIDLLAAVELNLTVRLGQARRSIREILTMGSGSVLELDNQAGEAVDILVNGRLLARGEVVIVGENFAVRIVELVQDAGGEIA